MRFMLDTMIFDHIIADVPLAKAIGQAVEAGRITLVTTHIQEDQIAKISDEGKRDAISRIPRRVVSTTGLALGVSRLGMVEPADNATSAMMERIGRRHLRTVKDAPIAASARDKADAIVTEDKTLRKRIPRVGLKVTVVTFEDFRRHILSL